MKAKLTFRFIVMILCFFISNGQLKAQTVAQDFTMTDCSGNMQHLFAELDQEDVVIMEFFMLSCNSCILAGNRLNPMYNDLANQYPGRVHFWQLGYTNSYDCVDLTAWASSHGYNSVVFDSGAAQVAYYGGFGMPTIAVVAGSQHQVLFKRVGFQNNDTTTIGNAARNFLNTVTGLSPVTSDLSSTVFPNPSNGNVALKMNVKGDELFSVYTVTGEKVGDLQPIGKSEEEYHFDLSYLKEGVYVIAVHSADSMTHHKIGIKK